MIKLVTLQEIADQEGKFYFIKSFLDVQEADQVKEEAVIEIAEMIDDGDIEVQEGIIIEDPAQDHHEMTVGEMTKAVAEIVEIVVMTTDPLKDGVTQTAINTIEETIKEGTHPIKNEIRVVALLNKRLIVVRAKMILLGLILRKTRLITIRVVTDSIENLLFVSV